MRSDCIANCIQNQLNEENYDIGFPSSLYVLRKNYLEQDDIREKLAKSKKFDNDFLNSPLYGKINNMCYHNCRPDCVYNYYSFEIKNTKNQDNFQSHKLDYRILTIQLNHGGLPDVVIKYIPQTTFLSLVCNFGGLLGMWLGLSMLNVLDSLVSILKHWLIRYPIFSVNQNIFQIFLCNKVSRLSKKSRVNQVENFNLESRFW